MIAPKACRSLDDVREGIDAIDRKIFELFVQRLDYVYTASQFKPDQTSISAPDRVASMLAERQQWARDHHIDEALITALYENIINQFISAQIKFWRKSKALPEEPFQ